MATIYYLGNLLITIFTLLPGLSGIFYHLPLSKRLIRANLITNENEFLKINRKRTIIFLSVYIIFIILSWYFVGVEILISTVINLILCVLVEWKKILGKDISMQQSFLSANEKYFKDKDSVILFINDKVISKYTPEQDQKIKKMTEEFTSALNSLDNTKNQ